MKKLAQKLIEEKKIKATEMVNKKVIQDDNKFLKMVSVDENNKTANFVMSTSNIDRHGDVIDQDSWITKYFEQNPYFALQHRSDEFPIGKWLRVWKEEDPELTGSMRLMGQAQFNTKYEDGARAFDHVVNGEMSMVSVGFIPHRVEYDETRDAFVLFDCELLECSLVGIGSNRQALVKTITENKDVEEVIDIKKETIKVASELDKEIRMTNTKTISKLKAHELLCKAIRQMN